jgi:hypothetical protein
MGTTKGFHGFMLETVLITTAMGTLGKMRSRMSDELKEGKMKKPKYADENPLERLRPGEPYFFVRAQDLLSPSAVLAYAELLQQEAEKANHRGDVALSDSLVDQSAQVAIFAREFMEWQKNHPEFVKLPD